MPSPTVGMSYPDSNRTDCMLNLVVNVLLQQMTRSDYTLNEHIVIREGTARRGSELFLFHNLHAFNVVVLHSNGPFLKLECLVATCSLARTR